MSSAPCLPTRIPAFASAFALLVLAVTSQADSPFRASDLDLSLTQPAVGVAFHPLPDGTHLVSGSFTRLDGHETGPLVLLSNVGELLPRFEAAALSGAELVKGVKTSDGGYLALFHDADHVARLARFSSSGILISLQEPMPIPAALFSDGSYLYREPDLNDSRYFYIRRGALSQAGSIAATPGFAAIRVLGSHAFINRIDQDNFLLTGDFQQVNGQPRSSAAVKFSASGAVSTAFQTDNERIVALSGQLFAPLSEAENAQRFRLTATGSIDSTFSIPEGVRLTDRSQLASLPGGFLLFNVLYSFGNNQNATILRLNQDGSVIGPPQVDFASLFGIDWGYASALLPSGQLLVYSPGASLRAALYDPATDAAMPLPDIGNLDTILAVTGQSNHRGELILHSTPPAVFRADGSKRVAAFETSGAIMASLPDGRFVNQYFEFFDGQGNYLEQWSNRGRPLKLLPDGRWLVLWTNWQGKSGYYLVRLNANGSIDPIFKALPRIDGLAPIVAAIDGKVYAVQESNQVSGLNHIVRLSEDGSPDTTFQPPSFTGSATQLMPTPSGVYLAGWNLEMNGISKPFGARFSLNGSYDASYAPEALLAKVEFAENNVREHFDAEGHSIVLAYQKGVENPDNLSQVWHIDPFGQTNVLDPDIRWKKAAHAVSPNGDTYLAGERHEGISVAVQQTKYTRQPLEYSYPIEEHILLDSQPISLEVNLPPNTPAALQWTKDGSPISGQTSTRLNLAGGASALGAYRLQAQLDSRPTIVIGPIEIVSAERPSVASVLELPDGGYYHPFSLAADTAGRPAPTYQWFRDGHRLDGETSHTLAIGPISNASLGTYRVRASNALGDTWSEPYSVVPSAPWNSEPLALDLHKMTYPQALYELATFPDGTFSFSDHLSTDDALVVYGQDGLRVGSFSVQEDYPDFQYIKSGLDKRSLFLLRNEYPSGQPDQIVFTRLLPNGSIDTAFGVHTMVGSLSDLRLAQFPDGRVLAETPTLVKEISPHGQETSLFTRQADVYIEGYIAHRRILRLNDGTYIGERSQQFSHLDASGALFSRLGPQYKYQPGSNLYPGYIDFWPSGKSLYYDSQNKKLQIRNLSDGSVAWELPLPSHLLLETPIRLQSHPDRIYAFALHLPDQDTATLVWIDDQGNHNIGLSPSFPLPWLYPVSAAFSEDQAIIVGVDSSIPNAEITSLRLVNADGSFHDPVPLQGERAFASLKGIVGPTPDGGGYVLHDGWISGDTPVGPIVKLRPDGSIDTSVSIAPDALPSQFTAAITSDGGLLLLHELHQTGWITLYDEAGQLVRRLQLPIPDYDSLVFLDRRDRLVVANRTVGPLLQRFSIDTGSEDAALQIDYAPIHRYNLDLAFDASHRIYVLSAFDQYGQNAALVRLSQNGSLDTSFTLDPAIVGPFKIFLDRTDRLHVAASHLYRMKDSGEIDPTFTPFNIFSHFSKNPAVFANGMIRYGMWFLDSTGALAHTDSSLANIGGYAFGNRLLYTQLGYDPARPYFNYLDLAPSPLEISSPQSTAGALGSQAAFEAQLKSAAHVTYRWYHNSALIPGENGSQLHLRNLGPQDAGQYQAVATWDGGSHIFPPVTLQVIPESNAVTAARDLALQPTSEGIHLAWTSQSNLNEEVQISSDGLLWTTPPIPTFRDKFLVEAILPLETSNATTLIRVAGRALVGD